MGGISAKMADYRSAVGLWHVLPVQMSGMNRGLAACWTCLLLCAFLWEPVLSKGGRGGSRGSSRGSPSRSSTAGGYRGGGAHAGTRSRFRVAGRTSPVRVASAAAAGAAVALTADKWYASAYRRSNADSSEEQLEYYNRTNYFDALRSGSSQNGFSVAQLVSVVLAAVSPNGGLLLDTMQYISFFFKSNVWISWLRRCCGCAAHAGTCTVKSISSCCTVLGWILLNTVYFIIVHSNWIMCHTRETRRGRCQSQEEEIIPNLYLS